MSIEDTDGYKKALKEGKEAVARVPLSLTLFTVEQLPDGRFKFTIDGYSRCLEPDQAKVLLVYLKEKLERK